MTLSSHIYRTTPKYVEVVAMPANRQLDNDEMRDLIDWIQLGGNYPWLKGDATVPHRLEPIHSTGIYIEPDMGRLVIRNNLTSVNGWANNDQTIDPSCRILRHSDGTVTVMPWSDFLRIYSPDGRPDPS